MDCIALRHTHTTSLRCHPHVPTFEPCPTWPLFLKSGQVVGAPCPRRTDSHESPPADPCRVRPLSEPELDFSPRRLADRPHGKRGMSCMVSANRQTSAAPVTTPRAIWGPIPHASINS